MKIPTLRQVRTASGLLCLTMMVGASTAFSTTGIGSTFGWVAASLFIVSLGFNRAYDRAAFRRAPRETYGGFDQSGLRPDEVLSLADEFESQLDWRTVDCLLDGAVDPPSIRMRGRERIEARTRSLSREVQIDFALHRKLSGRSLVPIVRFQKGELQDFRRVADGDGSHASVLTFRQSTGLYLAVLRWCLLGAGTYRVAHGKAATSVYEVFSSKLESEIAQALISRTGHDQAALIHRKASDRAIRRLRKLARRAEFPAMVEWGAALADVLTQHYMIVARLQVDRGAAVAQFQDVILPMQVRRSMKDSESDSLFSRLVSSPMQSAADRLRVALGSRPPRLSVNAQLARNCRSYHLEVVGPEGTFVSRQGIENFTRAEMRSLGVYDRWRGRHGQRYAHLYVRGASQLPSAPEVKVSFMERPPGSIGLATLGAFAAFFLWATWHLNELATEDARVGLAATFLVFPAGLAAWVGFTVQRTVYGIPTTTQIVNLLTITTSLAGFYCALADLRSASGAFSLASGLAFVMSAYWWYGRYRAYADCLSKSLAPEASETKDRVLD